MTMNQPYPSKPTFQTPQPSELQSEESQDSVRRRLSAEQGLETDTVDEQDVNHENVTDSTSRLEKMEKPADRHLPNLDSPPG